MKKYFIWPLALLLMLLGASLAWADATDDIRQLLDDMPAHMNVKYGEVKLDPASGAVVVSKLSMYGYAADGKAEEAGDYFECAIDRLELTNPNLNAFEDTAPSLLAERIVAKGIKVFNRENGVSFSMQQFSMDKPWAPWNSLRQLKTLDDADVWRTLAYVRIEAFSMDKMEVRGSEDDYDPFIFSMERLAAQNLSLLYCTDMHMHNFKVSSLESKREQFTIADIKLSYNLYEYLLPMFEKQNFSMADIYQLDPTNKYDYRLVLNNMKSTFGSLPFSIKNISLVQNNHQDFHGRFVLDSLRIESKDLNSVAYMGDGLQKHILNGKPLIFSLDVNSTINVDKFLPSYIKMEMPGLGNFNLNANLALKPDYLRNLRLGSEDIMQRMLDFDEQMKWVMKNALLKDLGMTYQDKGLINGLVSYYAADSKISKARAKAKMLASLDKDIEYSDPGLAMDFLKNVKRLLQKPGTLDFSMAPTQPVDLAELFEIITTNPQSIKYNFKVK